MGSPLSLLKPMICFVVPIMNIDRH